MSIYSTSPVDLMCSVCYYCTNNSTISQLTTLTTVQSTETNTESSCRFTYWWMLDAQPTVAKPWFYTEFSVWAVD